MDGSKSSGQDMGSLPGAAGSVDYVFKREWGRWVSLPLPGGQRWGKSAGDWPLVCDSSKSYPLSGSRFLPLRAGGVICSNEGCVQIPRVVAVTTAAWSRGWCSHG